MRRVLIAASAAALLVLGGCAQSTGASSGDTGFVAGDGSVVALAPADRKPAPAFSGTTLDGTPFTSDALSGKVGVLNVWASWCAPCRAEAPALERVAQHFANDEVQFVGLDTRDSMAAAQAFVDRFGLSYPSVVDTDGAIQLRFHDTLPPQAIPSTLVIDRQGRVAARFLGPVDESTLTGVVTDLLGEQP